MKRNVLLSAPTCELGTPSNCYTGMDDPFSLKKGDAVDDSATKYKRRAADALADRSGA